MKIDIISGFLGAGKTTFIQRLLKTNIKNEKVVIVENEFGEVSVDSQILAETKVDIKELSQGCICCSLSGDFSKALTEVVESINPDRIIIEPSGVGKLSDVVSAVKKANLEKNLNSLVCIVDVNKAKMYTKNFGEFFLDQIKTAHTIVLSRTDVAKEEKVIEALEIIREYNPECVLVTTAINNLSDEEFIKAYEGIKENFVEDLLEEERECGCGHHHHHHDADEVFSSFGMETAKKYDLFEFKKNLDDISMGVYGVVIRAKGVILGDDNKWYLFNLTPDEVNFEETNPAIIGKICIIGSKIDIEGIRKLF